MRRILLLIVIMALSPIVLVNAQSFRWGLKGGISVTDVEKRNEGLGWFIGPMLDVSLPLVGFSADVSALYYQVEYNKYDKDFTDKYIEMPLNIKWSFLQSGMLKPYLSLGPQLTYLMEFSDGEYANHWAASFNVGAGVRLFRHFQVGINYNLPLGRTIEQFMIGSSPQPLKRKGVWMSLAYLF